MGCPASWTDGGYHCLDHDGCRHVNQGPFTKRDCKEECFIVVSSAPAPTPAPAATTTEEPAPPVPFCPEHHEHYCPHEWSEKKHHDGGYHCKDHDGRRSVEQGPFPDVDCQDQCAFGNHIKPCPHDHEHQCPASWTDGGYHCLDHDGCRHVNQG